MRCPPPPSYLAKTRRLAITIFRGVENIIVQGKIVYYFWVCGFYYNNLGMVFI